ncbi:MAG: hypothetical protein V8R14_04435 [Clostridia bacterium]
MLRDLEAGIHASGADLGRIKAYFDRSDVRSAAMLNEYRMICAVAAVNERETGELYEEFGDLKDRVVSERQGDRAHDGNKRALLLRGDGFRVT